MNYLETLSTPYELSALLQRYALNLVIIDNKQTIPGSYWGGCEAGLIKHTLYARKDTPIHSILHESCHYVCMDQQRRNQLHTDAQGDYDEENGVCYLQILLADQLSEMTSLDMMKDMDTWGYTFRLGSAQRWYEEDANDAEQWLKKHTIITYDKQITFNVRL